MNRPKAKLNNPKHTLTNIDIEQIVLMAWGDTIPFETIELEYGLTENQVRTFMRTNQTEKNLHPLVQTNKETKWQKQQAYCPFNQNLYQAKVLK